jgi:hypothetical protein
VQWGIGIVINLYPTGGGSYAPEGYRLAFGASVVLQVAALFWFFRGITTPPGAPLSDRDRS